MLSQVKWRPWLHFWREFTGWVAIFPVTVKPRRQTELVMHKGLFFQTKSSNETNYWTETKPKLTNFMHWTLTNELTKTVLNEYHNYDYSINNLSH